MRFWYQIFPEQHFIVAGYVGRTTVADIKALAGHIWADPEYNQNFNGILDYTEATLDASPKAIDELCQYFLYSSEASLGRAALLVTRPLETALNSLFVRRMQQRNALQMFCTWEAACRFHAIELDRPDAQQAVRFA